jgi:uncharacterized protein (TIGR03067 family)
MRHVLPLFALLTMAFAPAPPYRPKPDLSKEDLRQLQGAWGRVHCSVDGAVIKERPGGVTVKIEGARMAFGSPGDTWSVTLDAGKKPKRIDCLNTTRKGKGSLYLGLYRLEGETLTISWRRDDAGGGRPLGFDPAEPNVMLHAYTRIKP